MKLLQRNCETWTISEFMAYTSEDIKLADKMIGHIKRNKVAYAKLVFIVALLIHADIIVFADTFESSLGGIWNEILKKIIFLAKMVCMGMGLKSMISATMNGGNLKQATTEGIQYWLAFLFIQFYPQLFDLFKGVQL